jgi:shikimate kinase
METVYTKLNEAQIEKRETTEVVEVLEVSEVEEEIAQLTRERTDAIAKCADLKAHADEQMERQVAMIDSKLAELNAVLAAK